MQNPILILRPEMRWIQSAPSTSGAIQHCLVLYDAEDFPPNGNDSQDGYSMHWLTANQAEIAQDIDDDDFPHPIYVIHTMATRLSDSFAPIDTLGADQTGFSRNICQYDSAFTAHCLSLSVEEDMVYIKSGFHYWPAASDYDGPTSWSTMDLIFDGFYRYLKLNQATFWTQYQKACTAFEDTIGELFPIHPDLN